MPLHMRSHVERWLTDGAETRRLKRGTLVDCLGNRLVFDLDARQSRFSNSTTGDDCRRRMLSVRKELCRRSMVTSVPSDNPNSLYKNLCTHAEVRRVE